MRLVVVLFYLRRRASVKAGARAPFGYFQSTEAVQISVVEHGFVIDIEPHLAVAEAFQWLCKTMQPDRPLAADCRGADERSVSSKTY